MTAQEFKGKLDDLQKEGDEIIAGAKKSAEESLHLQQELTQGVDILKSHFANKMQTLINQFTNPVSE